MKNKLIKLVLSVIALFFASSLLYTAKAQNVYGKKDAADYVYISGSFDINMAFGIKENEDTVKKDRGFDWDVELGAREEYIGVYLYYGRFDNFDYQNYGLGVDFYVENFRDVGFLIFDGIEFTFGAYYTSIGRKQPSGSWGWATAWISPRVKTILWTGDLAWELITKYQVRPELPNKDGVFEVSAGLTYKFDW